MAKHEQYQVKVSYDQNGAHGHGQTPRKCQNPVFGSAFLIALILAAVIVTLILSGFVTIFEDGSFKVGLTFPWLLSGCLPGGLCNF